MVDKTCLDSLLGLVDDRHDDVRTLLGNHGAESRQVTLRTLRPSLTTSTKIQMV